MVTKWACFGCFYRCCRRLSLFQFLTPRRTLSAFSRQVSEGSGVKLSAAATGAKRELFATKSARRPHSPRQVLPPGLDPNREQKLLLVSRRGCSFQARWENESKDAIERNCRCRVRERHARRGSALTLCFWVIYSPAIKSRSRTGRQLISPRVGNNYIMSARASARTGSLRQDPCESARSAVEPNYGSFHKTGQIIFNRLTSQRTHTHANNSDFIAMALPKRKTHAN